MAGWVTCATSRSVSQGGGARRLVGNAVESAEEPPMAGRPDPATEAFLAHRNLLFTVAYEMLGSAADAEDVLQETWLRWAGVDLGTVRDQRAYLVRITTRQALARLRTHGRRKESYFGPWLPEPLLTTPDVAEDVELADSEPARPPRAGRRLPGRRCRNQAGRPAAHRGGRQGGPRAGRRAGQDRRSIAAAGTGQRLPGADPPAQRRDRHRHSGTHRRRPHHRALRRAQPREAVAYGAGDHPAPLSPGRLGNEQHTRHFPAFPCVVLAVLEPQ